MNYKLILSLFMILVIFIFIIILSKKFKLNKKQIIIFFILSLFWSSVSIIRAYRKAYANDPLDIGGLGLAIPLVVEITSAYGLISFFLRFPLFVISDFLNKKKMFIQLGLISLIVSSFLVYFYPSYITLYFSSLSMGACAGLITLFNVIFSDTFDEDKAIISVSILSLSPLLAEFIAAPIQYLATYSKYKNYSYLWLISAILAIITIALTFLIKEDKNTKKDLILNKFNIIIEKKSFLLICLIALIQSFSKFATSGANMVVYFKSINMSPLMVAYSDVVFATPQLIGGILIGTILINKIRIERILQIGIATSIIFFITILSTPNPYISLFSYTLNGFGYGLLYNSLISIALQYFHKEYRNISMGVFQLFFAAGIFFGDRVYKTIFLLLPNGIMFIEQNRSIFLITTLFSIISIILCNISIKISNRN